MTSSGAAMSARRAPRYRNDGKGSGKEILIQPLYGGISSADWRAGSAPPVPVCTRRGACGLYACPSRPAPLCPLFGAGLHQRGKVRFQGNGPDGRREKLSPAHSSEKGGVGDLRRGSCSRRLFQRSHFHRPELHSTCISVRIQGSRTMARACTGAASTRTGVEPWRRPAWSISIRLPAKPVLCARPALTRRCKPST